MGGGVSPHLGDLGPLSSLGRTIKKMLGLTRIFARFEICSFGVPRDFLSGGVIQKQMLEKQISKLVKTLVNTYVLSSESYLSHPFGAFLTLSSGERETLTNTSILKDSEH